MSEMASPYSFDDVLEALADSHRRELLVSLLLQNPQNDAAVFDAKAYSETSADVDYLEMYHVHLSKLAGYGFIDWDRENGEVTKGPKFDEIRPLLELLNNHKEELPDGWWEFDTFSTK